jgi:hypothetical protein
MEADTMTDAEFELEMARVRTTLQHRESGLPGLPMWVDDDLHEHPERRRPWNQDLRHAHDSLKQAIKNIDHLNMVGDKAQALANLELLIRNCRERFELGAREIVEGPGCELPVPRR